MKLMLTLAGFKNYQTYQSRDAVRFFEKKAINLRDVFALRYLQGRPVFATGGKLTPEGMETYWNAQNGEKSWLMPYENPRTPEEDQVTAAAQDLMKKGFREISEPEYLWLMKVTTCPDDILRAEPCNIKVLKAPKTVKYFLCFENVSTCFTKENGILATYILKSRAGEKDVEPAATHSAFFGSGGSEKRRFCHNGKIWNGE